MDVSRRDLLKGGAVVAAGLAATAGLTAVGCTSGASQSDNTVITWDKETDIVVIGFGGAGASAAIEAADNGASVVLLEKQKKDSHICGTLMSGGNFHCPDPAGDVNELKAYYRAMIAGEGAPGASEVDYPENHLDPLVDAFVDETFKNLELLQSIDSDFDPVLRPTAGTYATYPGAGQESGFRNYCSSYTGDMNETKFPTVDMPKEQTNGGLALMNCLKKGVEDRTNMIEVIYEAPASSLVKADDGTVLGVVASIDGKDTRIKGNKGVIICSGGYEFSETLRDAFLFGPAETGYAYYSSIDNTGDGIMMAMDAGAKLYRVSKFVGLKYTWQCPDVTVGKIPVGARTDGVGSDGTIIVDATGKRFANESLFCEGMPVEATNFSYPLSPAYLVFDESRRLDAAPLVSFTYGNVAYKVINWGDDQNQTAIDKGWIIKGDTIEDLANNIASNDSVNAKRMDASTLSDTLSHYNDVIVPSGVDDQFGRTSKMGFKAIDQGPFYALPVFPGGAHTTGPLLTDEKSRVLDWQDNPIPHLYAAGELNALWLHAYMSGCNITECLVRGRLAGRNAAGETVVES